MVQFVRALSQHLYLHSTLVLKRFSQIHGADNKRAISASRLRGIRTVCDAAAAYCLVPNATGSHQQCTGHVKALTLGQGRVLPMLGCFWLCWEHTMLGAGHRHAASLVCQKSKFEDVPCRHSTSH